MLRTRVPALALLASAAALTGCGSDDDGGSSSSSTAASTPAAAPASGPIDVVAKDFSFSQTDVTHAAGKVTIDLDNQGAATHELVLIKTDAAPDELKVGSEGRVPEDGSVGEVSEVKGGGKGTHTFDLAPGKYVFVCNIPGHYADGMHGSLTVR